MSTTSRVRIWKHSLQLIRQRPVSGYGFGLFEREYNLSAAKERLPGTEPVSMPYNDFVQLGVEGGLPAVAAWALCIGLLVYDQLKGKGPVLPVAAWLLIQLTNFGFQNIPAFALFLLYAGIEHCTEAWPPVRMPWRKIISIGLSVFAACLLVAQWRLAQAFYQVQEQAEEMDPAWVPAAYEALYARLYNAPYYLERVGDTRMAMQQYTEARRYYLQAMYYSSHESLLGKTGYCYQQEKRYDSSEYYFTLLQNMAPARFSPRMALLNMYRQKGDTVSMIAKATEIIHLPVKVPGAEVERIKTYAHTLLNELRK